MKKQGGKRQGSGRKKGAEKVKKTIAAPVPLPTRDLETGEAAYRVRGEDGSRTITESAKDELLDAVFSPLNAELTHPEPKP